MIIDGFAELGNALFCLAFRHDYILSYCADDFEGGVICSEIVYEFYCNNIVQLHNIVTMLYALLASPQVCRTRFSSGITGIKLNSVTSVNFESHWKLHVSGSWVVKVRSTTTGPETTPAHVLFWPDERMRVHT